MHLLSRQCEICKKRRWWFLVKRRSLTIMQIGVPIYKDNVCDVCIKKAKQYFNGNRPNTKTAKEETID